MDTNLSSDGIKVLWAKSEPLHPLWKHMLDASAVSMALSGAGFPFGWDVRWIAFLVGLHDIGKADAYFQYQNLPVRETLKQAGFLPTGDTKCRHERISATFIKNQLIQEGIDRRCARAISMAVVAHHGRWDHEEVRRTYPEAQEQLYHLLQKVLGIATSPLKIPSDLSAFGMFLAGHIVLCDWIASNEAYFTDRRLQKTVVPEEYFGKTKCVAQEWVAKLGFRHDGKQGLTARIVETPRPVQQVLLDKDIPPGLVIIEAPMGEGKTEAAWILAEKWRDQGYHGMYMALPTMATSDGLYLRYRKEYLPKLGQGQDVRLVHGMAWLRDEEESQMSPVVGEENEDMAEVEKWFRPTRRAMLASHGVGTVDQAMLAGMNVKFGFLRLYGLVGRVLVIDEVHAYDAYMNAILARLLQWCACLKIPTILLSATLSERQRTEMIEAYGGKVIHADSQAPYPLITVVEPGRKPFPIEADASSSRTLKIETHPGLLGNSRNVAEMAAGMVRNGGCCCVLLNTVREAQKVYREIQLPPDEKLLFHARFKARDRRKITGQVLRMFGKDTSHRPPRFVLIATQVVEQSLDVDFDSMISEIAPIDLLLQRSGRLHRHSMRTTAPTLHVLLPEKGLWDFGGTGHVYATKILLRTLAILATLLEIKTPHDFRVLIEKCYGASEWPQEAVSWEHIRLSDRLWDEETKELHVQGSLLSLEEPRENSFSPVHNDPVGDDDDDGNGWRGKTRLGANDCTALLLPEEQVRELESGDLPMVKIRDLYRQSLKWPGYLSMQNPAPGFYPLVKPGGRLRGLTLVPVAKDGTWQGMDDKKNRFQISYDEELGLSIRRVE